MKLTRSFACICSTFLVAAWGTPSALAQGIAQTRAVVSPTIPKYRPVLTVTEEIKIAGTDSLGDSAAEWDNSFRGFHPQSRVSFTPQLSTAAIQGLIQGTSTIVLSARDMTPEELTAFQAKNGYSPTRIPLCLDAIIVFVNKGNPLSEISLDQLDAIYSNTHLTGTKLTGTAWGEFGARGDWRKRNVTPYSREEGAAIRSWFLTTVLRKGGKFKDTVQSRLDAMGLAEAVVTDPTSIAYSSMQSWYSSVKVIAVAPQEGQKAEPPSQEAVYSGKYPLVRSFYMFVNKAPGKPMAPAYQEFARYLLAQEGQSTLADTGFIPAPPDFILMGSKRLN
jgi:phosphate transport system substrate-binding protein